MQETPVQFLGQEDPLEKGQATHSSILGLPGGSDGKEPACNVGELGVLSLGLEDPLEEGMATLSSILAWRIPMNRGAWQTTILVVAESDMTE